MNHYHYYVQGRHGPHFDSWKLWLVVGVTLVSCLALLWALFSGATPDKVETPHIPTPH
jgi:hypothetical protein